LTAPRLGQEALGQLPPPGSYDAFADSEFSPLYKSLQRFIRLRNQCHPFRYGYQAARWGDGSVLAFSRITSNVEIVVTMNFSNRISRYMPTIGVEHLSVSPPGAIFVDILSPQGLKSTDVASVDR
jgi:hypothetical protein